MLLFPGRLPAGRKVVRIGNKNHEYFPKAEKRNLFNNGLGSGEHALKNFYSSQLQA
jgi:hypothetical protein